MTLETRVAYWMIIGWLDDSGLDLPGHEGAGEATLIAV